MTTTTSSPPTLRREIGLFGATLMGLGSILGTGAFVSIGIAAGISGPSVVLATALAALVATCNALNSAQLAAAHPVSGGAYEYGYRLLTPAIGFTAGWMFLCAKTASAATAALGFSGYALGMLNISGDKIHLAVALASVVLLTIVTLGGMRRSNTVNTVIVSTTIGALFAFVLGLLPVAFQQGTTHFSPFFLSGDHGPTPPFLEATALMFVAFTGYGRIATLGEEVHDPTRTIPRAIVTTLSFSAGMYIVLATVAIAAAGAPRLSSATLGDAAPLETLAHALTYAPIAWLVSLGAVTAMLGVLLNLILGLSRVLFAMARRQDMPGIFAGVGAKSAVPTAATLAIGGAIALLTLVGDVKTTWSFSAFTVLVYYAINNLAALRMPLEDHLYPRFWAWGGLASCVFLAFWVETHIWVIGLGLIIIGLVVRAACHVLFPPRTTA